MCGQVKEQQVELDDKFQLTNQLKEQVVLVERRCSLLLAEEVELRSALEQSDHAHKMAEHELVEAVERANLLNTQVRPCSRHTDAHMHMHTQAQTHIHTHAQTQTHAYTHARSHSHTKSV